jgi:predicted acyl esterase
MIAINNPLVSGSYAKAAKIPESDYNLIVYYAPTGILRALHHKTDASRSIHPRYPFHTHDEVRKIPPGEVLGLKIELWAMAIDFEAGESLSDQVSGESPPVNKFGTRKMEIKDRDKGTHRVHLGGSLRAMSF